MEGEPSDARTQADEGECDMTEQHVLPEWYDAWLRFTG
jgi:hypothetical protein